MLEGSMDLNRVNMFLGGLLELDAENMYRYKGLLAVADADERFVFQVSLLLIQQPLQRPAAAVRRSNVVAKTNTGKGPKSAKCTRALLPQFLVTPMLMQQQFAGQLGMSGY